MFSLKHEFPTEWYKFLHPADTATVQSMSIALGNERFPFQYRNKAIKISQAEIVLVFSNAALQADYKQKGKPLVLQLGPPGSGSPSSMTLNSNASLLAASRFGVIDRRIREVTSLLDACLYACHHRLVNGYWATSPDLE